MPSAPTLASLTSRPSSFSAAKKLYDEANHGAQLAVIRAIECGRMLRILRDTTVSLGGDRRSAGARESVSNVGHCSGFVAELEKVGIPKSTAYDWIAQAEKFDEFLAISEGERKTLLIEVESDGAVKQIDRPLTDKDRVLAARHIANIESGTVWPKRAWAGFRSGMMTNGGKRAAPDVFSLIREAIATLDRQLPKLKTLTDDERVLLKKFAGKTQIADRILALEDLQ